MGKLLERVVHWLALDTEEGAAGIEYAIIAGLALGGLLVWMINWRASP